MYRIFAGFLTGMILFIFFSACEPEKEPLLSASLKFSADTVLFDTLFTQIGSPTYRLKVYNTHNRPVHIESIGLARGSASPYRLNINGADTSQKESVIIRSKDSLFIFVEITINKIADNDPKLEKDSIVFQLKDKIQDVKLLSWGQDVYFHRKDTLSTSVWTNDKPHLVYDCVYVDSLQTLTLKQGTQIYFHNKASFKVKGSLVARGSFDEPVVFQSDRKDDLFPGFSYSKVPGQWKGVELLPGSDDHDLNYVKIFNATSGLKYMNNPSTEPKRLNFNNSIIRHSSLDGLALQNINFLGYNNEITSCGRYAINLSPKGNYEFYHCTIANFWNSFSSRITPTFFVNHSNHYEGKDIASLITANSIVYGNHAGELNFTDSAHTQFSYQFDHCFIKLVEDSPYLEDQYFTDILTEADSLFVNPEEDRYTLDSLSPAVDAGDRKYANPYPFDMKGNSRIFDQNPDLGAYEKQD